MITKQFYAMYDVKLSRRLKLIKSSQADSRVNSLKSYELTRLSAREDFIKFYASSSRAPSFSRVFTGSKPVLTN